MVHTYSPNAKNAKYRNGTASRVYEFGEDFPSNVSYISQGNIKFGTQIKNIIIDQS